MKMIFLCVFFWIHCFSGELSIHILFSMDNSVAVPTTVCIASLLRTSTEKESFHFHFVGEKLTETNFENLLCLKKFFRSFSLDWMPFDLSRLNMFKTGGWNKKIMLKLFVGEIFPNLEKVLWMDCDMVVLENIRELYENELKEKYFAAVDICPVKKKCRRGKGCDYWFNTGIVLFNVALMRKEKLQDFFVKEANKRSRGCKRKVCLGGRDEYVFSVVSYEKTLPLPFKWNVFATHPCILKQINVSEVALLHFIGPKKPWSNSKSDFFPEVFEIYMRYMNLTVYLHPDEIANRIQKQNGEEGFIEEKIMRN